MISGIVVCVEIALEVLEKCLRMRCVPSWLVLVQNNGVVRVVAGLVQPHIAVRLGLLSRFM